VLKTRIIPVLLIKSGYFVKTTNFNNPEYIGDPLNIVKIFNDKKADELTVFDISTPSNKDKINLQLIENIASNARMPLCYGGGISNINQVERLFSIGIEKVSISKNFFKNCSLLSQISKKFGSQSIAVTLDINIDNENRYFVNNQLDSKKYQITELIKEISHLGAGEIIINCVHKDGTKDGYDQILIDKLYRHATTPMTIVGGAKSLEDIYITAGKYPMLGLGVGSLFIYKGRKKAVLINYPKDHTLETEQ
tara:strand:- start:25 stop:777 length:753 start_codon:yes stop_codon:yes gene_type:complete